MTPIPEISPLTSRISRGIKELSYYYAHLFAISQELRAKKFMNREEIFKKA
jgi:hypothetical protein